MLFEQTDQVLGLNWKEVIYLRIIYKFCVYRAKTFCKEIRTNVITINNVFSIKVKFE